jgi:hypothetical protein
MSEKATAKRVILKILCFFIITSLIIFLQTYYHYYESPLFVILIWLFLAVLIYKL